MIWKIIGANIENTVLDEIYFSTMEPFQSVRKTLTILGINQNGSAFIDKVLIAYYVYCSSTILSCVFFFTEAESFREYTDSIYTLTANIAVTFCFTYIIIEMDQLFQYIEDCRKIVYNRKWKLWFISGRYLKSTLFSGSESKAIYVKSIEQLEKWNKLIYFVVAELSPILWVAPKFLMSLFVYMRTNFDNNALEVPLPIW